MTDDELQMKVIEALHADAQGYRRVVRDMARDHGDLPAHRLEAALMAAAREIDATIRQSGAPTDEARTARRLAMLLGMDIDRLGDPTRGKPVSMDDLMEFWSEHDDFFLRL